MHCEMLCIDPGQNANRLVWKYAWTCVETRTADLNLAVWARAISTDCRLLQSSSPTRLLWCALKPASCRVPELALACILFLGVVLVLKGAALGFVQCLASSC
jgi:hypothetical protein